MTGMPDEQGQHVMSAEEWAGRDIGGLHALAGALSGFAAQLSAAWHADPVTAATLAAVIGQTAGILDVLAVEQAMAQAQQARQRAATQLTVLFAQLGPAPHALALATPGPN